MIALIGVNFFVWHAVAVENRGGQLTLAALDVGQGDAIFIEAPNGTRVIFDGGPDSSLITALRAVMPFYDRRLDAIFVTNPDKDHLAGFIDLLVNFEVAAIFESGTKNDTEVFAAFQAAASREVGAQKRLVRRGQRIVLDEKAGVFIDILFPDRDVTNVATNDGSIVAKLSFGQTCAILTGDAPKSIESYLFWLDRGSLDCEVLKVGHHGSKTSTSPEFLDAISPQFALISVGAGNSYGHPHAEVLKNLENYSVSVLRTDRDGTVILQSDGTRWFLKN